MRRDMDLIRELLLRLEALPLGGGDAVTISWDADEIAVPGHDVDQIAYHLSQIEQAGFINDAGAKPLIGIGFMCLTPRGHDFLDAVREPKVWVETKTRADKVGGWTVGILTDLAKGYLKAKAAEHGFPMG